MIEQMARRTESELVWAERTARVRERDFQDGLSADRSAAELIDDWLDVVQGEAKPEGGMQLILSRARAWRDLDHREGEAEAGP